MHVYLFIYNMVYTHVKSFINSEESQIMIKFIRHMRQKYKNMQYRIKSM